MNDGRSRARDVFLKKLATGCICSQNANNGIVEQFLKELEAVHSFSFASFRDKKAKGRQCHICGFPVAKVDLSASGKSYRAAPFQFGNLKTIVDVRSVYIAAVLSDAKAKAVVNRTKLRMLSISSEQHEHETEHIFN